MTRSETRSETMSKAVAGTGFPNQLVSVRSLFGIGSDLMGKAFREPGDYVPTVDPVCRFNREVTLAILAASAATGRCCCRDCTAPASRRT
jgi:5,10-methenyltetrahydromethanopterin hydrogenase